MKEAAPPLNKEAMLAEASRAGSFVPHAVSPGFTGPGVWRIVAAVSRARALARAAAEGSAHHMIDRHLEIAIVHATPRAPRPA